jgi:Tfp pilus assembly protein PilW
MNTAHTPVRAFTLIELLVSTALCSPLVLSLYAFLSVTTIEFAKNTAINMAHQQARVAVLQMEQDIHSSVSLPQLVDTNRVPVATTTSAAGISFQLFAAGPFKVAATASAGQANISVNCGTFVPQVGQRFCIPAYQTELDITAVGNANSGVRTLTLASNLPQAVVVTMSVGGVSQAVDVTGFITDRVSYVVSKGELHYYGRGKSQTYTVMASDITNTTPFSTPTTAAGSPNFRFVAAINLTTSDPTTKNRHYKTANMFINSMVPCRTRLCVFQ